MGEVFEMVFFEEVDVEYVMEEVEVVGEIEAIRVGANALENDEGPEVETVELLHRVFGFYVCGV